MSEIQSNYPRAQVSVSDEKANLVDVEHAGGIGQVAVYVILLAIIIFNLGPRVGFVYKGHSSLYGLLILVIIAAALPFFVNLYKWSSQAHYALCLLKGYRPKISSVLVGVGSALSLFLFAIPIWIAFDFLIVHSEPNGSGEPSFSWSSAGLRFFVPYALFWLWILIQFLPIWNGSIRYGMIFGRYALLAFAVWSGCRMVSQIDKNLRLLAKTVRQQAVATGEDAPTTDLSLD
jgi:hypothetical protein